VKTRRYRTLATPLAVYTETLRGFYAVRYDGRGYAVRVGYHLVPCTGPAHADPHIDNCGMCAPLWGVVPIPLAYGTLSDYRDRAEVPT
jgi:hypothetical protein